MSDHGASLDGTGAGVLSTGSASRFNAVKHGLTAKTPVLPGEDPAVLQAKIETYQVGSLARNEIEKDLAEMAAIAWWEAKRAQRQEVLRVTRDIARQSEGDGLDAARQVAALGRRLFFDRRGPWQLYPYREYHLKQQRTSSAGKPDDKDDPHDIVLQLEATREGRHWLLAQWGDVRRPIEADQGWQGCEKLKVIRLMGKQPLDALWNRDVALVFLASHAAWPNYRWAFHELECEIEPDDLEK